MNIHVNKSSLDGLDQYDYYGHMKKARSNNAAVSELKASLSEYLDRVKRGHEVVVTDRGRPIAKLVPFKVEGPDAEQRLELAGRGIIQLGNGAVSEEFMKPSPFKDPKGLVLKGLLEDRRKGW